MERTVAKRAFSRLANNLLRTYEDLSEQDLENGFKALTKAAEKVWEVNDDLEAKLIADEEAELDTEGEAVLTEQQKADLTKTASESASKLKEIKHLVQDVLWSNCGANEVLTSLEVTVRVQKHCRSRPHRPFTPMR